jgi:hypothetical protein
LNRFKDSDKIWPRLARHGDKKEREGDERGDKDEGEEEKEEKNQN